MMPTLALAPALSPGSGSPALGFLASGGPSYMSMSIHWNATASRSGSTAASGLRGHALARVAIGAMCSKSSSNVPPPPPLPPSDTRARLPSAGASPPAVGRSRFSPAMLSPVQLLVRRRSLAAAGVARVLVVAALFEARQD
jgi:hypothetical protein